MHSYCSPFKIHKKKVDENQNKNVIICALF
ncbi:MAG TPA: hypothetical protein DCW73_02505 [Treponema sp.]|nr:hypothetical protein [Treponema sp.]